MRTNVARLLCVALLPAGAGCAASGHVADDLCRSVGIRHAYAATPTQVSDVRSLRLWVAPTDLPGPHATAFPGAGDSDAAAWCWVDDDGEFRVIKVDEKSSQAETAVSAKALKGKTRGAIKLKK